MCCGILRFSLVELALQPPAPTDSTTENVRFCTDAISQGQCAISDSLGNSSIRSALVVFGIARCSQRHLTIRWSCDLCLDCDFIRYGDHWYSPSEATITLLTFPLKPTVSIVESEYEPCACSPLGKLKRIARPHALVGRSIGSPSKRLMPTGTQDNRCIERDYALGGRRGRAAALHGGRFAPGVTRFHVVLEHA